MPFVTSTLSSTQAYTLYDDNKDVPREKHKILIGGGANVVDPKYLWTPLGIVTEVSEEDLALLETVPLFKTHVDGGFITVDRTAKTKPDVEKTVANMEARDDSAPLTPGDYEAKDKDAPTVSGTKAVKRGAKA